MASVVNGHLLLIVTPSAVGTTARWDIEVWSQSWGYSDSQACNYSGAAAGSIPYTASAPSSSTTKMFSTTVTAAGVRGGTYYLSVSISGAYDGSAPSLANVAVTIPVVAPSVAPTPTADAITDVSFTQNWGDPSDWGGNDSSDFDAQIATNSGMTGATTVEVLDANTRSWTGRTGNTQHWVRERAKNSAGAGSYSPTLQVLTKPSKPTSPAVAALTPVLATLTCVAPAGDAPDYQLQVATDAAFTALVYDVTAATRSRDVPVAPGTQHWYRWAASNATGTMGFTTPATFTTPAGVQVWSGSAWVDKVPEVWDGTAWRQSPPEVWSGSDWEVPTP